MKVQFHTHFRVFWGKNGENWNFFSFIPLECNKLGLTSMNQTASKWLLRFSLGMRAKIGVTKKKTNNHPRVIFQPFAQTPHWGDRFEFFHTGHIADVITLAKLCDNWFRGFGVLTFLILPFSIELAGRPYNSVSITMLHCDVESVDVYWR